MFFYSMQQQWTISQLDCDMRRKLECIQQLVKTSSVVGLRSFKAPPKATLAPKKAHVYCLVLCSWSDTLQLSESWRKDSLHLRSTLSKSMSCTKTCNACSQRWSTEMARLFSRTTHNRMPHNQHFKSWTNWATKFCFIPHIHLTFHQPTTISSSISIIFCGENTSTTSKRQKMLSKSLSNPEAQIFMLQE